MSVAGKVLVADDYEPTLSGLRELLEAAGHTVHAARDGTDALRLATAERPDVVLLDVLMPGLSGIEVCAALKQSVATQFTPVLLISGSGDRDNRVAGRKAGADDFISKPVDSEELGARVGSAIRMKRLTDELDSADALFLSLGRIVEARDPMTEGHCERLASYATALGTALGLSGADLRALYRGGFIHDIGKIGIPDRILLRKGRLSRRDYEQMKQHPVIGDALCGTLRSLADVRCIVRHHHERLDGRGYPDGLAGDRIPLLARIVSVVDVFDALTTDRLYRKALAVETAYEMLLDEARAGWSSECLVRQFIDIHQSGRTHVPEEEETGTRDTGSSDPAAALGS